jgi:hypothetical protein
LRTRLSAETEGGEQEGAEVTVKTLLKPKRAVGRPKKPPARGKRAALSLLVRPALKRLVDQMATANGTTQSAQAEYLIEQGIAVRQVLDAMGKTLEEIERDNADAALRRRGYARHRFVHGGKAYFFWTEPGFPIPTSGFEPWAEGELKARFPDYEENVPDPVKPPPLPPEMAGIDPDRLYLVPASGGGWEWKVGKAGWSSSQDGENK